MPGDESPTELPEPRAAPSQQGFIANSNWVSPSSWTQRSNAPGPAKGTTWAARARSTLKRRRVMSACPFRQFRWAEPSEARRRPFASPSGPASTRSGRRSSSTQAVPGRGTERLPRSAVREAPGKSRTWTDPGLPTRRRRRARDPEGLRGPAAGWGGTMLGRRRWREKEHLPTRDASWLARSDPRWRSPTRRPLLLPGGAS